MTRTEATLFPEATAIVSPFTVLIDSREKAPYRFTGIHADADQNRRPIYVPTRWQQLATGDYSVEGLESMVCVERKSLADLFSTLGQRREQFQREHERMAEMVGRGGFACVVIEADWGTILNHPPEESRLPPKVVFRTAISWQQRFHVPWMTMGGGGEGGGGGGNNGRRLAEITTFRVLEKFWKSHKNREE